MVSLRVSTTMAGAKNEEVILTEGVCGPSAATRRGSFDVHAADRVVTAREKERKRLRQITEETGDQWRPDKFYTDELKTEKPWINPYEVMVKHLVHPPSEGELTPKADSSSSSSSISSDFDRARRKAKKKKKKAKKEAKKLKKERKKLKKKLKRLKA
ncbi:hypothetical protein BESB_002280 [Besnoitia besnoiti]|uniref:Uncharacterized protein n=1 Tax=Besnoitia besnoiti TaxID=94643 RepID=A0A2A9MPD4_BESBE|nr:hypothetical protein BESB_002280 [Besnoitia besnoiti]PFH37887.1 hypothetical protein BESB_002280 [Besnoitia besnoiti]